MVPAEVEALAAWMMGALVLDAPPAFLVCTHRLSHRVAFLDFFETYLEGVLVAIVPLHVRMPKHVAERTLFVQLAVSEKENTPGHIQTRNLIRQVKRAEYNDATRRLTFVVKDTLLADSWHHKSIQFRGTNLKLLSTSKLEEEDMQMDVDNEISCLASRSYGLQAKDEQMWESEQVVVHHPHFQQPQFDNPTKKKGSIAILHVSSEALL